MMKSMNSNCEADLRIGRAEGWFRDLPRIHSRDDGGVTTLERHGAGHCGKNDGVQGHVPTRDTRNTLEISMSPRRSQRIALGN
jgi:hypothetical protein